jgi:hypothetical protein
MLPDAAELERMPTLCVGQCCSLKIEDSSERVWLCRVYGGVTIEQFSERDGRWVSVAGGCRSNDRDFAQRPRDELARWHRDRD